MFKVNTFISINILSQLVVTVISTVRFLYLTGCMNFYHKDGQDWLYFGFRTHIITISRIIPHRRNNFKSQDFNYYPFLNYIYIIYIFSSFIIIIFNCDGVVATQHNICTFVVVNNNSSNSNNNKWNLKCTIVPVIIGATGIVTRSLKKNLETIPGKHSIDSLQKTAIFGTPHIIRKVLQCEA